jgi:O-antigen/teichoic acid export membrane protein
LTTPPIATAPPSGFGHHIKKISHQSSVFLLGTLFTTGAGYFFKIYVARVLGAELLGIYALGMTAVSLAGVIAAMGLPQTANRFVAVYAALGQSRKLGRFLWSCTATLLLSNVGVGFLLFMARPLIAGRLYHTPALTAYMHFFVMIMITGALTTFLGQALAGFKDVARRTVITNFIGQSLTMALTVILLTMGYGFQGYLVAQVASAVCVVLLLGEATWKLTPSEARAPSIGWPILEPEVVSYSAVLFGIQALEFLGSQSDKILLGVYLNAREVGIYSVAAALVAFVSILLQSTNQIFAPTIAELHASHQGELLLHLYQTLTKWVLGFTLPLAFFIMIFSRPLMEIFGREFGEGWVVLAVATFGQLVNCGVGSVGQLLVMSGQQQRMMRAQAFAVPLGVLLNILLIPKLGLIGAAIAAAVTNMLLNLLWLRDVKRTLSLAPSRKGYVSLLAPAAATVAAVWLTRVVFRGSSHNLVCLMAGLIAGYAVFVLAALAMGLDPNDRMLAQRGWEQLRNSFRSGKT